MPSKPTGPGVATMTDTIARAYHDASPQHHAEGARWYADAHATAQALADRYGRTTYQVAGVIAALSPRMPWARNVACAEELLRDGTTGALKASLRKAYAALGGAPHAVLNGPKTVAFAALVNDPGADTVCIDTWALRVAGWHRETVTPAQYRRVAQAYRIAAERVGLKASTVQAITWVAARGTGA